MSGAAHETQVVESEAVVSTGFADPEIPGVGLEPNVPLELDHRHVYWLELGPLASDAIDAEPAGLVIPSGLGHTLDVVLFDPHGQIRIEQAHGQLEIDPDSGVGYVVGNESAVRERRLLLPLRTPSRTGRFTLRSCIYAEGVLLQSRLVTFAVGRPVRRKRPALRSQLDFNIAASTAAIARPHEQHALSLLLNDANGSHSLYAVTSGGERRVLASGDIQPGVIEALVEEARVALNMAAWGSVEEWQDQPYRYKERPADEQLRTDLVRFAMRGYALYDTMLTQLGIGDTGPFADTVKAPVLIQMAHVSTPTVVLPLAMVYDHPLDTGEEPEAIKLCPAFLEAYHAKTDLRELTCIQGTCPTAGDLTIVCPSGFWGFRHGIGLPISGDGVDLPSSIGGGLPRVGVAAVATDPAFIGWSDHQSQLSKLPDFSWTFAFDRTDAFEQFATRSPQLVYFYCHGGLTEHRPYVLIGPLGGPRIYASYFRATGLRWNQPRPLVVLNGCHTTSLGPEQAHPLVAALVTVAGAAGVIGTETTIFEPLATSFAEAFLAGFDAGAMVGWAIRDARLTLLREGNPLGLVYIPYVMPDLRLAPVA